MLNYQELCQQMETPPFRAHKQANVFDIMCVMEVQQFRKQQREPSELPHDNHLWEEYWVRMKVAVYENSRGSSPLGSRVFLNAIAPLRAEIFGRRQF